MAITPFSGTTTGGAMSEPIEPAETGEEHVEDIDVEEVPEPDEPDDGEIDPDDTYTEGPAE